MTRPTVGFAGLTHLGLVSSIAAAAQGFAVIGYDADTTRVRGIVAGKLPVVEPGLDELAHVHGARLRITDRSAELAACDIVYIATDVPTDDRGQSDLKGIAELIERVTPVLGPAALLVVLCQVPPGFTRALAFPKARLFYQVETLVFGRAVERALKPERFIVGMADPAAALPPSLAAFLGAFGCPILPMRYESAELAKISINCCLVASVTVANTLAELSERVGADWSEIAPALKLDRRIGAYSYLAPGLGIAGGNLERDLATVLRIAGETGAEASLIEAFLRNSRHRRDWALHALHDAVLARKPDAAIGVLGLAYKENTHSTKNSPSLALIEALAPWRVKVFDPVVPASAAAGGHVAGAASAYEAARDADALAIMTPWPEFRALDPARLARVMAGRVLLDPFRVLDEAAAKAAGLDYLTLGAPPASTGALTHA